MNNDGFALLSKDKARPGQDVPLFPKDDTLLTKTGGFTDGNRWLPGRIHSRTTRARARARTIKKRTAPRLSFNILSAVRSIDA